METSEHSDSALPCPRFGEVQRAAITNLAEQLLATPALVVACLERLPGAPPSDTDLLLAALRTALERRPDCAELHQYAELARRALGLTWIPDTGPTPACEETRSGCERWNPARHAATGTASPCARAGPESAGAAGANAAPAPMRPSHGRSAGSGAERSAAAG